MNFNIRLLLICFFLTTCLASSGDGELADVSDLASEMLSWSNYQAVFYRSTNRNAASHRWVNWIFERAHTLDAGEFTEIMKYFCPVSGSPISNPNARGSYKVTLPQINGEADKTGAYFVCCSPCVCDTVDFIKVAQMEVTLKNDVRETFDFLVIADPCPYVNEEHSIPPQAGDVYCTGDILEDAVYIDGTEYYIIGMLHPEDGSTKDSYAEEMGLLYPDGYCDQRAAQDYPGGMGKIFRGVAEINPSNSELTESWYSEETEVGTHTQLEETYRREAYGGDDDNSSALAIASMFAHILCALFFL